MNVIITGVTGMVGEGVLNECLNNPEVKKILVVTRRPSGYKHEKLTELIHKDFFDLSSIENQLTGFEACYFCLGLSSIGITKEAYEKRTYDLTLLFGSTLSKLNTAMTFCYVSGAGTDSSEKGRSHWARVKGKTENDLMKLPFKNVFAFRPGYIQPVEGMHYTNKHYRSISWSYPMLRFLFPSYVCSLPEIGQAMINCVKVGYEKSILEVKDIVALAK